jgi:pimeloyl-ACP methyl ester carboxylesterase
MSSFHRSHPDDAGSVSDTIVLIHGLWMTPRSWERWIERYESRGYTVVAPSWPGLEGDVEALRRDPSPLAELSAAKILAHYEKTIRGLESPPIIMGHSFGGAFAQILIDRGLGAAGVSIDGATVRGIRDLPLSTLRSTAHVLTNPFNRGKAVPLSEKHFRYAFGNTLDEAASRAAWERYAVPAAARVLFEGAMANLAPKTPFPGRLGKPRPRSDAVHRRQRGPRRPREGEPEDRRQGRQVRRGDRVQGVPRPFALHRRRAGLGGGRRLRAHVGHRARRPQAGGQGLAVSSETVVS